MFRRSGELVTITKLKKLFNYLFSIKVIVFITTLVVQTLLVVFLGNIILTAYHSAVKEDYEEGLTSAVAVMSQQLIKGMYFSETEGTMTEQEIDQFGIDFAGQVLIVDTANRIKKDTYNSLSGKVLIEERTLRAFSGATIITKKYDENILQIFQPIIDSKMNSIEGVFVFRTDYDTIRKLADNLETKTQIMFFAFLLLALGFSLFLSNLLVIPLKKVASSAVRVREGMSKEIQYDGLLELVEIVRPLNQSLQQLEEMNVSRQEFVSNVSHELKTPITSIRVLADALLMQEDAPIELYKEFMQDISDEIDRESKIISDLLSLVKLDNKDIELNTSLMNINELIELILKRLRLIAKKNDIEVILESFRPVMAEVDEVKFSLAISNLIENAVKYNAPGGWVHVSLNADHKYFYVKISDSGVGIPQDAIDKIFNRFYRVDKARSRDTGGTGLGLAITKNVINLHQGAIRVFSKEGEGTTFTVRIPLRYVN